MVKHGRYYRVRVENVVIRGIIKGEIKVRVIDKWGNYSVVEYSKELTAIDFSNENMGVTVQTFTSVSDAVRVFGETVKTLPENKAKNHNTEIIKAIIKG